MLLYNFYVVMHTLFSCIFKVLTYCFLMGNHFSVQHSRSMVKFESDYNVETVFDGSKLGIEPHSVQISPNGEFLVLDSENSNIYKISGSMSRRKLSLLKSSKLDYTLLFKYIPLRFFLVGL